MNARGERGNTSRGVGWYSSLGLSLITAGVLFALVAWLVLNSVPLIALGGVGVFLGAISLGLSRTLPRVSLEAGVVFLDAGWDNIGALVEEMGIVTRAVYLPGSVTGTPKALLTFQDRGTGPLPLAKLKQRFLVRTGSDPEDFALLLSTPGSVAVSRLRLSPGNGDNLERALIAALVGGLDLAEAVHVPRSGEGVTVELRHPALSRRAHPADAVLGSPLASIVAAICAEVLGRGVSVDEEHESQGRRVIRLRLHDGVQP